MLLPIEVELDFQFRRVPPSETKGRPNKVHPGIVIEGQFITLHDFAQNGKKHRFPYTKTPQAYWPWGHSTVRATSEEYAERPCLICKAAFDGKPLPGRV